MLNYLAIGVGSALGGMMVGGLVTLEKVKVVRYGNDEG